MPSEVARCTDCGAPLKGVPAWLSTARVRFTCPKHPARAARFEAAVEPRDILAADPDLEGVEIEDIDEEADLEVSPEGADEAKPD